MSVSLTKRWIALAVGLLIAAAAGAIAVSTIPSASAQEPASTTFVLSGIPVLVTNGFATLPEFSGAGDGVLGAACTGASPLGGSANVPAQVVTELRTDLTHMRILRSNGTTITGTVRVNCVLDRGDPGRQRHTRATQASRYGGSVAREFIGDGRRNPAAGLCPPARPYRGRYGASSDPTVFAEVPTAVPRRAGPVGRTGPALLLTWLSQQ